MELLYLQTALFTLAGTRTLVLALGSVKLVRECYAHTLMVVIFRKGGRGADAVCRHGIVLGVEDVVGGQGYAQRIVLQERFGKAEIDYTHCFLVSRTLLELWYIGRLQIDEPSFRQSEGIVEDDIKIWVVPVVVDTDGFKVRIPKGNTGSELRLPNAESGGQCHHCTVRMGFWNDLIIYDGYTRMCFIIISLSNGSQTVLHVLIPSTPVNPFP